LVREISWAKNVLIHQIESKTYEQYLLNQTNFNATLPQNYQTLLPTGEELIEKLKGL
jgi:hypothetical protein